LSRFHSVCAAAVGAAMLKTDTDLTVAEVSSRADWHGLLTLSRGFTKLQRGALAYCLPRTQGAFATTELWHSDDGAPAHAEARFVDWMMEHISDSRDRYGAQLGYRRNISSRQ